MYSIRELAIRTLMRESDSESEAEMISIINPTASTSSDPVLPTSHDKIELISITTMQLQTSRLKALDRDEKQYTCMACKKSFSQKNNFKRHTLTHTGVKPYNCALCGRGFS